MGLTYLYIYWGEEEGKWGEGKGKFGWGVPEV